MNYTTNDTDKTVLKKLYHEIEISYKRRNMVGKVWIGREINHQLLLELENDLCRSSCQQKAGCLLAGLGTIFCLFILVCTMSISCLLPSISSLLAYELYPACRPMYYNLPIGLCIESSLPTFVLYPACLSVYPASGLCTISCLLTFA
jgi:hypothetical protein